MIDLLYLILDSSSFECWNTSFKIQFKQHFAFYRKIDFLQKMHRLIIICMYKMILPGRLEFTRLCWFNFIVNVLLFFFLTICIVSFISCLF